MSEPSASRSRLAFALTRRTENIMVLLGLPPWFWMWTIAVAIFSVCKFLTVYYARPSDVPVWRKLGYLCLWPGMDADAFLYEKLPEREYPMRWEWLGAFFKCAVGATLFWVLPRVFAGDNLILYGWLGMIGLVLMLHFGAFHLLSCLWRMNGVAARPLQRTPLLCASLTDFWGRGWNTAFRDLTHKFLFRPLTARIGARRALFVGFLVSGLVHDLVISVPAGGGYGSPTIFFLVQAGGIFIERSRPGRALGLGAGWRGRMFMFSTLGLPLYGLFHPPFVRHVIVPFMKIIGA